MYCKKIGGLVGGAPGGVARCSKLGHFLSQGFSVKKKGHFGRLNATMHDINIRYSFVILTTTKTVKTVVMGLT